MKTIIVVDDEYLVRLGIRETIDWDRHGFTIVGEAANGKTGLELIERLRPDIVLSDVKMPFLDGVELTKAVRAKGLDLAVVILSGFKDFDFAKGALEHGAAEYLLKPIDNAELIAAVERAAARLDAERARNRRVATLEAELPAVRRALLDALVHKPGEPALAVRLETAGIAIPPFGRVLYGVVDAAETYLDENALSAVTAALAQEIARETTASAAAVFPGECYVFTGAKGDDPAWTALLRGALARFETDHADVVSLAFSRPYEGLSDVAAACLSARTAAKNKFFPAVSTIASPAAGETPWKPLVVRTMELIARDYAKNITVKTVTDELYVSESYLLHTFKQETGVTFNECLTNYRILAAKKLLLRNEFKVYEIAAKIGYADEKYFSTVFKKLVGMTPTEYADRGGGKAR